VADVGLALEGTFALGAIEMHVAIVGLELLVAIEHL